MAAPSVQSEGNIITMTITGKLTQPELAEAQKSAAAILQQKGRAGILVLAEQFDGLAEAGQWDDLSFQANDTFIERMAIVADPKWTEMIALFTGKGIRKFPIEIFNPGYAKRAREWLTSSI